MDEVGRKICRNPRRIEDFCHFLSERCVPEERKAYIESLSTIPTGLRSETADPDDPTDEVRYLPTVRLANGEVKYETHRRLMLAFNTPFSPEILIASSVLAEGGRSAPRLPFRYPSRSLLESKHD